MTKKESWSILGTGVVGLLLGIISESVELEC